MKGKTISSWVCALLLCFANFANAQKIGVGAYAEAGDEFQIGANVFGYLGEHVRVNGRFSMSDELGDVGLSIEASLYEPDRYAWVNPYVIAGLVYSDDQAAWEAGAGVEIFPLKHFAWTTEATYNIDSQNTVARFGFRLRF